MVKPITYVTSDRLSKLISKISAPVMLIVADYVNWQFHLWL